MIPDKCTRCEEDLLSNGPHITSPSSITWLCEKCSNHPDLLNKYKEYPDHTKAMFSEFATMYREIKSMGLDPVLLAQTWK